MRPVILGTGAVAAVLAAILRDLDPVMVGRRRIARILLEGMAPGPLDFPIRGALWQDDPPEAVDLVLVAVKAPGLPLAERWLSRTAPTVPVLVFMNGMGQEAVLAHPGRDVGVAVTTLAATRLDSPPANLTVHLYATGDTQLPPTAPKQLLKSAQAAGFSWRRADPPTLLQARWLKLAQNSIINPLTALAAIPNGELPAHPLWRLAPALAKEAHAVAEAHGVRLPPDLAEATEQLARATGKNRSSMLQDVLNGVPTEIEAINGYLVQMARKAQLSVPVNQHLVGLITRLATRD